VEQSAKTELRRFFSRNDDLFGLSLEFSQYGLPGDFDNGRQLPAGKRAATDPNN
jgi:hypothetical protein